VGVWSGGESVNVANWRGAKNNPEGRLGLIYCGAWKKISLEKESIKGYEGEGGGTIITVKLDVSTRVSFGSSTISKF
jgi:hypothetical protein